MVNVLTVRKLSRLARVATQYAGRTRTFGAILRAGRTAAAHWGRVLHQLWLEVTGFVFLALAGIGAIAVVREWVKYQSGRGTSGRAAVAIVFTVTFAWFGLSSFWRVRRRL
jgi:hypothetical protein